MLLCKCLSTSYPASINKRRGTAAVEFAVVAPFLFLVIIGIIEFGRVMMVLGVVTNASRSGARAGAVTVGNRTAIIDAVNTTITRGGVSLGSEAPIVRVNGTSVATEAAFTAAIRPGATIEVEVRAPYSSNKWLPGTSWFFGSTAVLSARATMRREG